MSGVARRLGGRWLPAVAVSALVAGSALVVLTAPGAAAAHAVLELSSPASGAVVNDEPHKLRMVFDEEVVPRYARVSVDTPTGQHLSGAPRVVGRAVIVPLRTGPIGSYTVRWRMVAADDGHVTEGAYSFGVRVAPLPPAPAGGVDLPVAPEVLAWLQLLGVALTGGMLTVRALIASPRRSVTDDDDAPGASAVLWTAVVGAVVAVHAGVLALLAPIRSWAGACRTSSTRRSSRFA